MEETVKNSLVFAKLMSTSHSIQLALFVQTLVQVKIKLFWLGIKLSVINNLICFGNGDTYLQTLHNQIHISD